MITLIKSVCYHHRNVRFYLIHQDYPSEWFLALNKHLVELKAEIIPVTILKPFNFDIKLEKYITQSTFYRYLIPDIPEEKILYLDSDIIVDGNIENMYSLEFNEILAYAVKDMYISYVEHDCPGYSNMKPYFNAGVLLINNRLWQKNRLKEHLIQVTQECPGVSIADQDILNIVLKDKWGILSEKYNYQTGAMHCFPIKELPDEEIISKYRSQISEIQPKIIHYTTKLKPWIRQNRYIILLKEKYWFYYQLSWEEIKKRHQELFTQ